MDQYCFKKSADIVFLFVDLRKRRVFQAFVFTVYLHDSNFRSNDMPFMGAVERSRAQSGSV